MDPKDRLKLISNRWTSTLYKIPKSLSELLSFMDSNVRKQFRSFSFLAVCGASQKSSFIVQSHFENAFRHLSLKQKLDFFQKAVEYAIKVFNSQQNTLTRQMLDQSIQTQLNSILNNNQKLFSIVLHQGFTSNTEVDVEIQKFLVQCKNNFTINLQDYLIRKSKRRYSQCYMLQAINQTKPQRVKFSFRTSAEEQDNIGILRQLTDLAFKNTIVSMLETYKYKSQTEPASILRPNRQVVGIQQPQSQTYTQMTVMGQVKLDNLGKDRNAIIQSSKGIKQQIDKTNKSKANQQLERQIWKNSKRKQVQVNQIQPSMMQVRKNTFNQGPQGQNNIKQTLIPKGKHQNNPIFSPIRTLISSQTPHQSSLRQKNIFQLMLPEFNLHQFQPAITSKQFKQIYMTTTSNGNNFTIFQHIKVKQRFKCSFVVDDIPTNEIYLILINEELIKKWNQQVDQSQIKMALTAENYLICYQKHRRYSAWFKQRDYLFMRHPFTYKGYKYIADRSIQHTSFIPFQSIQRGYIRHAVTRLKQINNFKTEVIVDLNIDHGGYIGKDKKKQLNLNYLKQYQKVSAFIQKCRNQSYCKKRYCNIDWNIDRIDLVQNEQSLTNCPKGKIIQQFNDNSQIDSNSCGDNIQLESEQFYSVKDDEDTSQSDQFNFPTTDKQQDSSKSHSKQQKKAKDQQSHQKNESQVQILKQIQDERNISVYNQPSILETSIVINGQGYCVLPQKYIRKKHIRNPIENYEEQRARKYANIVLKDDFVQDKEGGLLLTNKKKIQAQDNVINFIMKTMKKNIFGGKSILSISLPVQIFKEDSNTQRLCESMSLGPQFLQRAAKQANALQRMKWAICFGLSNSIMYFYIEKPFNPILGQTYQGVIDGCPIYAEQVSHHPPISSIYFVGRGYRVYANIEAKVFLHLNSADGVNSGRYTIQFDDGHVIKFQTAPGELSGFTIGARKYRYKDRMYVIDPKNSLYSQLLFQDPNAGYFSKGKWAHGDQMEGQIVKVTSEFVEKFQQSQEKIHPKPKNIEKVLSKIEGRWIHYLGFDGKKYYDIVDDLPYKMVNQQYPLNSDARYRQDLIYRTKDDLVKSQIHKEYLQNKQRKDRKLRQQYTGKNH